MENALFVVSPLYLLVGFLIAVLVIQELLRGQPRHAHHHSHHHAHHAHRHHR